MGFYGPELGWLLFGPNRWKQHQKCRKPRNLSHMGISESTINEVIGNLISNLRWWRMSSMEFLCSNEQLELVVHPNSLNISQSGGLKLIIGYRRVKPITWLLRFQKIPHSTLTIFDKWPTLIRNQWADWEFESTWMPPSLWLAPTCWVSSVCFTNSSLGNWQQTRMDLLRTKIGFFDSIWNGPV